MLPTKRLHYCGHCKRQLGHSAFWEHRSKYFNQATRQWTEQSNTELFQPFVPSHITENQSMGSNEDHQTDNDIGEVNPMETSEGPSTPQSISDSENSLSDAEEHGSITDSDVEPDENYTISDSEEKEITDGNVDNLPYKYERCIKSYSILMAATQAHYSLSKNCMNTLLHITGKLIKSLANLAQHTTISKAADKCPLTVQQMSQRAGINYDTLTTYAACPDCSTIYDQQSLKEHPNSQVCVRCSNVKYPKHPRQSRREPCGTVIATRSQTSLGILPLKPIFTYTYNPISSCLSRILPRIYANIIPLNSCEEADMLFDITEGKAIRSQVKALPNTPKPSDAFKKVVLSLIMNVDWFQPYKHTRHSVGAIYLSINNLPRHLRYKPCNILLTGLIPGPREPKDINPFIGPIVDELKAFLTGQEVDGYFVQAFLTCTSNDNPAARKLCGFSSHVSYNGCYRCTKVFPSNGFGKGVDSSGYDFSDWAPKRKESVLEAGDKYLQASTPAERKHITRETGCRYSVLNCRTLPYFDPIQDTVIDPMHTLFLGIAKRMMHIWIESNIISTSILENIQENVNAIHVPKGITRIPGKITSGFSSLTADQWRIWTLLYSSYCLHSVLPSRHLKMLESFIKACTLMCSKVITKALCKLATEFILHFCSEFESLFGKAACFPNMHFACHIPSCLLRFGPAQGFWLFSFERYNGLLGEAQLNHKTITVQLMQHFLRISEAQDKIEQIPRDIQESFEFESIQLCHTKRTSSGVQASLDPVARTANRLPLQTTLSHPLEKLCNGANLVRPVQSYLHEQDIKKIITCISPSSTTVTVARECLMSTRCTCSDLIYYSCKDRGKCCHFYAIYENQRVRTGKILEFIQAQIRVDHQQLPPLILAKVKWLKTFSGSKLPFPWSISSSDEADQSQDFIPVVRILSRAAQVQLRDAADIPTNSVALAPVDFYSDPTLLACLYV